MKVNRSSGIHHINVYQQHVQGHAPGTSRVSKIDQVQISDEAKKMLEQNNQQVDPARAENIKELQEKIDNGTYQVDSRKVAEKLYEFWFND